MGALGILSEGRAEYARWLCDEGDVGKAEARRVELRVSIGGDHWRLRIDEGLFFHITGKFCHMLHCQLLVVLKEVLLGYMLLSGTSGVYRVSVPDGRQRC